MAFSKYRHRLILQEPIRVQSQTTGAITETWGAIGTVWASIEPLTGREVRANAEIIAVMDVRICMRWNTLTNRLTQAHRGLYLATVFNFVSIANVGLLQREIEIMAKSGANNG